MEHYTIGAAPTRGLQGTVTPPSDKSISHRSLIFASLAEGISTIHNVLRGEDVRRTQTILEHLGVKIDDDGATLRVMGRGLYAFTDPKIVLDCGNSGTTMRLMMGLLAAQPFTTRLTGDHSLNRRPMHRVATPLMQMGATISEEAHAEGRRIAVTGSTLHGIRYTSPVSSAQIKSAILLAGLYADTPTVVSEPTLSRDHTERFLRSMGASLVSEGTTVTLSPGLALKPFSLTVPGDPSSAAFFVVAALLVSNSDVVIRDICLNPTRIAFVHVLKRMGARIDVIDSRTLGDREDGETIGSLRVRASSLTATHIDAEEIPWLIDELPILALAFARATGESSVSGAEELRVKESDRLAAIMALFNVLGVEASEAPDGFRVTGSRTWSGGTIVSDGDHRVAMTAAIAGLVAKDGMRVSDTACVATSFPNFVDVFKSLGGEIQW